MKYIFILFLLISFSCNAQQNIDSLVNKVISQKPLSVRVSYWWGDRWVTLHYKNNFEINLCHYNGGSPFTGQSWYYGMLQNYNLVLINNRQLKTQTYNKLEKLYYENNNKKRIL